MKKLLTILLISIGYFAQSQRFIGPDGALHPVGAFPIALSNEIKGTPKRVTTLAQRDAIPMSLRDTGMPCMVTDSNRIYYLIGGITNDKWSIPAGPNSSGGIINELDPVFKNSPSFSITQQTKDLWNSVVYKASQSALEDSIAKVKYLISLGFKGYKYDLEDFYIDQDSVIHATNKISGEEDPIYTGSAANQISDYDISNIRALNDTFVHPDADYVRFLINKYKTTTYFSGTQFTKKGDTVSLLNTVTSDTTKSLSTAVVTKTAYYIVTDLDHTIFANATSGGFDVLLPAPTNRIGKEYYIEKTDASSNIVAVLTSSGTVSGYSRVELNIRGAAIKVKSDGSTWQVITNSSRHVKTPARAFFFNSTGYNTNFNEFRPYRLNNKIYGLIDDFTGEDMIVTKVTDTAGIKIDSVLYYKNTAGEVFKRVLSNSTLNIEWFGLVGDGTDNGPKGPNMAAKLAAYGPGYTLLVPGKKYICNIPFQIPSNFTILGTDSWNSVIANNSDVNIALPIIGYGTLFKNITIKNIRFEGLDNRRVALAGRAITNLYVDNVNTNVPLLYTNSITGNYADNNSASINHNIRITNCVIAGTGDLTTGVAGILLQYIDGAIVTNVKVSHTNQGIQWWGGDSGNPNEGVGKTKWATNITISSCQVWDIYGGGIWGSNGQYGAINNCIVWLCYDVGIDLEGCNNFAVNGGNVRDCTNGNLTTFFACKAILFSGISSTSSTANSYLFKIYNAYQSFDNEDITVENCTFKNNGTGLSFVGGDNARDFVFKGNTLDNVKIRANANNFKTISIESNSLFFHNASTDSSAIINVGNYHTKGSAYILKNTVLSFVVQPLGVMAIYVEDNDPNTNNKAFIKENITLGFNRDIVVNASTINSDIYPEFYIENNTFGGRHFERVEKLGHGRVILNNNRDARGLPFPSEIPTVGKWDRGQKIEYEAIDSGYTGAVCIAAGIPGIWVKTGGGAASTNGSDTTITNDTTIVVNSNKKTWIITDPATVVGSLALSLPPNPEQGEEAIYSFGGKITSGIVVTNLTFLPGTGQSIVQPETITSVEAGENIIFKYNISNHKWYRQ